MAPSWNSKVHIEDCSNLLRGQSRANRRGVVGGRKRKLSCRVRCKKKILCAPGAKAALPRRGVLPYLNVFRCDCTRQALTTSKIEVASAQHLHHENNEF